jgi:hypothetical protein
MNEYFNKILDNVKLNQTKSEKIDKEKRLWEQQEGNIY